MTTSQPKGEPTIYLKVNPLDQDAQVVSGNENGELINKGASGYTAHLAPGFHQPEGGVAHRLSKEGNGDIVIQGLSKEGWHRVKEVFDGQNADATRAQILDAIIQQLPWAIQDRPSSGR